MRLRFRTTRADYFWASAFGTALTGNRFIVVCIVWGLATLNLIEKIRAAHLSMLAKGFAIPLSALACGVAIACRVLLASGLRTFFAKEEAVAQDLTLYLEGTGIEVGVGERHIVHPYSTIDGMSRLLGRWKIHGSAGVLYLFRANQVLHGDPTEYSSALHERRR